MNLTDLDTFVRVAEAGSFTAAATRLQLPKSTVSRRVARLEDDLDAELLQRGPRSFAVTEEGRRLVARVAPSLREIEDARRSLADIEATPRGRLRVTLPHDLGTTRYFAATLAAFRKRYPEVTVDVLLTARMIDLIEEGVDVGIRLHVRPLPDSSLLKTRRLTTTTLGIFTSPDHEAASGRPRSLKDLERLPCICHARVDPPDRWHLRRGDEEPRLAPINPTIVANDFSLVLAAVLAGAGVGMIPEFLAQPHLESGELIRVLPSFRSAEGHVSLVWPASRHLAPRVRAFIDFLSGDECAEGT